MKDKKTMPFMASKTLFIFSKRVLKHFQNKTMAEYNKLNNKYLPHHPSYIGMLF